VVTLHEMNPGRIDDGESLFRRVEWRRWESLADFEEPLSRLWVWDRTFLRWSRNGRLRAWLAFVTVGVRLFWGGGVGGGGQTDWEAIFDGHGWATELARKESLRAPWHGLVQFGPGVNEPF
jgi:hypothetical protein